MTQTRLQARVLIVEDDAESARVLEAFLRAGQYQHVGTATSGRAAIRLAESAQPNLVIMDIVLPGDLDGIQTADLIRARFDIPVLYLTGHTDENLFERARITAPFAYLTKPCDERDLKRAIEVALDRHVLLQRLKAGEAHMAEAQRVAHFGSWNWDPARDHIEASDELLRLAGLERGKHEPCLETFLQRIEAEDRPRMLQAIEALLRGEDPGDIDVRVHADSPRTLRLRGHAHFDADGKAFELVGTALDVTAEACARQEAETYRVELEARVAERTVDLSAANTRLQAEIDQRLRMERASERFRVALDSLPDAVFLIDPAAMRFIDFNETAMSSLGYTRAELLALGPYDVKPHIDKAMLRRRFAEVAAGLPDVDRMQAEHRCKDGSTFPVEVRLRAFFSEGQPLLVAVVRDISERLLTESQLREANERFQQLAENVGEVFLIRDLTDDAFLYVSPAYATLFGQSVDSLYRQPRSFLSQVHPDDYTRVAATFEGQCLNPQGFELEYRIVLANNEVRWLWLRSFPIRNSAGAVYRMACVAEDVTQRRASEEQLRNIVQTSMDGFWVTDAEGRLLDCNEASCRDLGYTREEMLARSISDLEALESPAETVAHVRRIAERGRDRFETRHTRKDGKLIDVEVSVYYQPDAEGGRFHAFVRDISERKRAEAARLAHEASQREALVREVHHRIKNNLHGVIGLMRQHIADHPEMQIPIEAAITQINTISVVHGLQSRMPQKELRLRELLPEICHAAAALAMLPQLAPVEDSLRADVWLDSNASVSIALVLNELIQNALKHGAQRDIAEFGISLAGDGKRVIVRICNPCTALPPDFDFAGGKGHGTGLGLVRTLLPRRGASLEIVCDGARVCAELALRPPVIAELDAVSGPAKEFS